LPVIATKDTFGYRATKFIKRNKVAATAAGVVALALLVGIIATTWQARVARQERDKAERIKTFLQDMFGASKPLAQGKDIKIVDLLNESAARVEIELADQPQVRADVLMTIGRTYTTLGMFRESEQYLRDALDSSLNLNGEKHPTTVSSMIYLAVTLLYSGKPADAETLARRGLELGRDIFPKDDTRLAVALYTYGAILIRKGALQEAAPLMDEALGIFKLRQGDSEGYAIGCYTALGKIRQYSGDAEGAKSFYRQAIASGDTAASRQPMWLGQALYEYGDLLIQSRDFREAEAVLRQSEEIYRKELGEISVPLGYIRNYLGLVYVGEEKYRKADETLRSAREILAKTATKDDFYYQTATATLGWVLLRENQPVEAESLLREAWEIRKKTAPGQWLTANNESLIGECLLEEKRYAEAEPFLKAGYETLKILLGDKHQKTVEALQRLIKLYQKTNNAKLAAEYGAQLSAPAK
jgi:serine/threonine-protein kinase